MKLICEKYQPYTHFVEKGKTDKVEEKKSVLYYLALNDICRIKFDKGINKDNEIKKCDYILLSDKSLYLVELKGENVSDTTNQFLCSLEYLEQNLKDDFVSKKEKFIALIVTNKMSSIPNNIDSRFNTLRKKLYNMSKSKQDFKDFSYTVKVVKNIQKSNIKRDKIWKETICSSNKPVELD